MGLPTGQYDSDGSYAVEGKHVFGGDFRRLPYAGFRLASPGYFETMAIPVLRGREFDDGDVYERPFVAVISESLARQIFGAEDPIGHRIMCGFDQADKWMTIVGVVGDVRQASPASAPGPELYMPLRQHPYAANEVQIVVRTSVEPESLTEAVRQAARSMSPDLATRFTTLEASVGDSIAAPRFRMALVSSFATLALMLAVAGMYAVMSYVTSQRTAELGLRVALGASAGDVARLVLGGSRAAHGRSASAWVCSWPSRRAGSWRPCSSGSSRRMRRPTPRSSWSPCRSSSWPRPFPRPGRAGRSDDRVARAVAAGYSLRSAASGSVAVARRAGT